MELSRTFRALHHAHPYRGAGPALNDTSRQVPMIFDNLPSALPFIKDGRLIAMSLPRGAPGAVANVPTFRRVGLER